MCLGCKSRKDAKDMDIFKITGIAVCGAVFSIVLKEYKPWAAICVGIISALVIFFEVIGGINYIFSMLTSLASKLNLDYSHMETVIKITGVSYIARFGTEICRDSGNSAIASNLEIAGKIIIVVLSLPVLISVINLLLGLL